MRIILLLVLCVVVWFVNFTNLPEIKIGILHVIIFVQLFFLLILNYFTLKSRKYLFLMAGVSGILFAEFAYKGFFAIEKGVTKYSFWLLGAILLAIIVLEFFDAKKES